MTDAKSSKKVSKDVTEPGTWASRGPGLKRLEEAGGAVLLSNSWLNKGGKKKQGRALYEYIMHCLYFIKDWLYAIRWAF